jgi:hypothetical protein
MGEKGHNTNLAAEFYVLSILYRLGINAHLTLGNKKSVDIVVEKEDKVITIDVKGLKDTSCFPIDNWNKKNENHFLIFVSFLKRIDDPNIIPDVFILPSLELENRHKELEGKSIIYKNPKGNRVVVEYNRLKKLGAKYKNKWEYFL